MFDDVVVVRDRLAELVDRLDPDLLTGGAARELWGVLDSAERLCAAGKTLLARRIAATHQRDRGSRTPAEELARHCGGTTGQAKDSIDTSQRLPELPPVEAALRRGHLSPAQANLISGAAAANPAEADRLVEAAATLSLPELRDECARVRAAADPDPQATNRRLHDQRYLRRYTDTEGAWNLHAKGTPKTAPHSTRSWTPSPTTCSPRPAGPAAANPTRPTPSTPYSPWPTAPPNPPRVNPQTNRARINRTTGRAATRAGCPTTNRTMITKAPPAKRPLSRTSRPRRPAAR
jgi:Domain of unknown function (DUF222)